MQERQFDELVTQLTHGEEQLLQALPVRNFPAMQDVQVVAEVEQVRHGEVHGEQTVRLKN